ncbi:MAG: signal peptidase I [Verrucomicrobiales bacterium]|nr:signal peptidase I [Verrucomicrobiales bacterium]
MLFFTPRYLKHAKLLHKGVTRFINYKRDILPPAKLDEIQTLRRSLEDAMKARDASRIDTLNEQLNEVCHKALPSASRSDFAENIEVFFVAIVIALGIRAYIVQPFKIPTGSMQPTLNGIIVTATEEDPRPAAPVRMLHWLAGKSYVNVIADRDGTLNSQNPISETNFHFSLRPLSFGFLTPYTVLNFDDGGKIYIKGPQNKVMSELGLAENLRLPKQDSGYRTADEQPIYQYSFDSHRGTPIQKGQILARGIVSSGDHVLVNKFAYHFRRPHRGEVFVFNTRNISGIRVPEEQGSQHYIKRLAGVPGDDLEVRSPDLYIDGQRATEPGFVRVMSKKDGYRGYSNVGRTHVTLGAKQYFALGDNSYSSSDSRYWGTVPQRNLVGPGLFCYLPFTSHWGLIR